MAQQLVFGEFTRKLDERYRLSLPPEFVETMFADAHDAVLVKEQTGALSIWNAPAWQKRYTEDLALLEQKFASGRLEQRRHDLQTLGRLLSTRHREVNLAGRARVLVPEGFREFLGAEPGDDVVLVGAAVCIEVWRKDAWQAHLQATIPDFTRLLESLTT